MGGNSCPPQEGCLVCWVEMWVSRGITELGFCGKLLPTEKPCV